MKQVLLAVAALGLIAAAPAPFRIGVLAPASGPCAAPGASAPAGERAYFDLLNKRLEREVLACPVASPQDAAAALAAGKLDMFGRELITVDEAEALAALRSGKADVVALEAAAWQRQCQATKGKSPCGDLKVVWRARPEAEHAFAVRRDLPDPMRYRLLGVHLAMHLEDRPAFDWASAQLAPGAADFEPAEAQALEPAQQQ